MPAPLAPILVYIMIFVQNYFHCKLEALDMILKLNLWNAADKQLIRTSLKFTEKRSEPPYTYFVHVNVMRKASYKSVSLRSQGKAYLECVCSKKFRIFGGKNGFARSLPLDADESMMPFSSTPLTSWTTSTQIYWSSLLHFHLHWRIDGQSLIWSTNVKVEIWWILPSKHIGVGLKARLMVGKRNGLGLNWEVPTQISKWYHILLILVERQNANIVEFTQMQQMLNDWERMWYWLSRLWMSKKELHFESKSHASLLVKMHSKRFRSRFLMQTSPFWFAGAGKNHLLSRKSSFGSEFWRKRRR